MKIAQITSSCSGSIGMLADTIREGLEQSGEKCTVYYTYGQKSLPDSKKIASDPEVKLNALKSRLLGNYGFNSKAMTARLISELKKENPDLIHIHNIHGHDVHVSDFFAFLAEFRKPVVYTFHDCWAFTGYCPHFQFAGCDQWKTACTGCPLRQRFSFFLDRSNQNQKRKDEAFQRLPNLTIVTPSCWLKEMVGQSFLKDRTCLVIPNGIDTSVFKPAASSFKKQYGIENKKMVLDIANVISERKGITDLMRLAELLPDDYQLILLGLDEISIRKLPSNIIGLPRTEKIRDLVECYSAADVFVNATHEDTFPTVNIEAISCGTPVVTYDTGGSPEIIDANTGIVVPEGDVRGLTEAVVAVGNNSMNYSTACRKRACELYDRTKFFEHYYALYKSLIKGRNSSD